jgi:hypothetical protein
MLIIRSGGTTRQNTQGMASKTADFRDHFCSTTLLSQNSPQLLLRWPPSQRRLCLRCCHPLLLLHLPRRQLQQAAAGGPEHVFLCCDLKPCPNHACMWLENVSQGLYMQLCARSNTWLNWVVRGFEQREGFLGFGG